jgi:hypothetical protein
MEKGEKKKVSEKKKTQSLLKKQMLTQSLV